MYWKQKSNIYQPVFYLISYLYNLFNIQCKVLISFLDNYNTSISYKAIGLLWKKWVWKIRQRFITNLVHLVSMALKTGLLYRYQILLFINFISKCFYCQCQLLYLLVKIDFIRFRLLLVTLKNF